MLLIDMQKDMFIKKVSSVTFQNLLKIDYCR